jgi:hypothetical protein
MEFMAAVSPLDLSFLAYKMDARASPLHAAHCPRSPTPHPSSFPARHFSFLLLLSSRAMPLINSRQRIVVSLPLVAHVTAVEPLLAPSRARRREARRRTVRIRTPFVICGASPEFAPRRPNALLELRCPSSTRSCSTSTGPSPAPQISQPCRNPVPEAPCFLPRRKVEDDNFCCYSYSLRLIAYKSV